MHSHQSGNTHNKPTSGVRSKCPAFSNQPVMADASPLLRRQLFVTNIQAVCRRLTSHPSASKQTTSKCRCHHSRRPSVQPPANIWFSPTSHEASRCPHTADIQVSLHSQRLTLAASSERRPVSNQGFAMQTTGAYMSPELRLPTLRVIDLREPCVSNCQPLGSHVPWSLQLTWTPAGHTQSQMLHVNKRITGPSACRSSARNTQSLLPRRRGRSALSRGTPRERPGALRARRSRVVISSGSCAPGWAEKKTSTRYGSHRSQVTLWRFPALGLHVRRHQPSTQENAVRSFNGPDLPSLRKATHGPCMPSSLA